MMENGFIHNINISRMHYDENRNAEIFKADNISNDDLSKLAMFFRMNGAEMHVSCNIIKGYVDSMDKMLEFVEKMEEIGVETVMFRELVYKDKILLPEILNLNQFEHISNLEGLTYSIEVLKYKDFLIKHYKTKQNPNTENVVTTMALKNGVLRTGYDGKVLKNFREQDFK